MAVVQGWSSRFGFLMASIGFAVGLGNIWRFPYVTGENGGSAFVLVYLVCVFVIGVPILMAEVLLGRRGQAIPPQSLARLAHDAKRNDNWAAVGYLNLATAFFIVVAYGVVAGWVIYYLAQALFGGFVGLNGDASIAVFDALIADAPTMMLWALAAMTLAGVIVAGGVRNGIERAVVVLMPMLFLLLVGLAVFNAFAGGMGETINYLFAPDFSKLSGSVFLAAVGQAFFSIGVAMAGMMMFGAYLPKNISISGSAFMIVIADTLVALLAGLVIFPFVFVNGLDPAGGTGLIFQTLPVAFGQVPGGSVIAILFFLLLSVAAVTSIVGLVEPLVAWAEERFGIARPLATLLVVGASLTGGVVSALSYNLWSAGELGGRSLGAWIDFVPNQVMLPLGGLLIAMFVAWVLPASDSEDELGLSSGLFKLWYGLLKYIAGPAVLIILITGLF